MIRYRRCFGAGRRGGGVNSSDMVALLDGPTIDAVSGGGRLVVGEPEVAADPGEAGSDGANRDPQGLRSLRIVQLLPADQHEDVLVVDRQIDQRRQSAPQPAAGVDLVDDLVLE